VLKIVENLSAVVAPPRTPLGSSQRSPRPLVGRGVACPSLRTPPPLSAFDTSVLVPPMKNPGRALERQTRAAAAARQQRRTGTDRQTCTRCNASLRRGRYGRAQSSASASGTHRPQLRAQSAGGIVGRAVSSVQSQLSAMARARTLRIVCPTICHTRRDRSRHAVVTTAD